jgi:hypothetical protein
MRFVSPADSIDIPGKVATIIPKCHCTDQRVITDFHLQDDLRS